MKLTEEEFRIKFSQELGEAEFNKPICDSYLELNWIGIDTIVQIACSVLEDYFPIEKIK